MAIIDFKEIPEGNSASGKQDRFELFAREFLETSGFRIIEDPDRGADGGRDLIVVEERVGRVKTTEFRWLVSCKHKAFSGKAVGVTDEPSIIDRLEQHKCSGFMGFYSTLVSSSLSTRLRSIENKCEFFIYDSELIERQLLSSTVMKELLKRFFPLSAEQIFNREPKMIFKDFESLKCEICGKDILYQNMKTIPDGIFVLGEEYGESNKYVRACCVCRGRCDLILQKRLDAQGISGNGWNDLHDLSIPAEYLRFIFAWLNNLRLGRITISDEAWEYTKHFIMAMGQIVMREQSKEEQMQYYDLLETGIY